MTHESGDCWERFHHFIYQGLRHEVPESQYAGTVKMGEEELERRLFHPNNVHYNWLAWWKRHTDGRDAEGSWKLRHPRHASYVGKGMQVHITLFQSTENDQWIDVYAHYEYDNIRHPIKHLNSVDASNPEGISRTRAFFAANNIDLYQLH